MPCFHPVKLKADPRRVGQSHTVPCGRCIGCKIERARQWGVRGTHEKQTSTASCFLTLTIRNASYRPEDLDAYRQQLSLLTNAKSARELPTASNIAQDARLKSREHRSGGAVDNSRLRTVRVPYAAGTKERPSVAAPEGTGESLDIRTHQLFLKKLLRRLRDDGPIQPIRFLMCGEYGEKLGRPHYHYVIFGYDFPDKTRWRKRNGFQMYRSSLLESLWPYGQAEIGEATFESIAYVARYVTKKITGEIADDHYRRTLPDGTNYWLQPEFNAMSRRPGLGNRWLKKYYKSVYANDRVVINDQEAKPPRYYDELLKQLDPHRLETVKQDREALAEILDQDPRRLRAGEAIARARLTRNKRPLE